MILSRATQTKHQRNSQTWKLSTENFLSREGCTKNKALTLEIPARFRYSKQSTGYSIQSTAKLKTGRFGCHFRKIVVTPQIFFLMFWWSEGVEYIPKKLEKLLGSPPFHFQTLEKILVWKPNSGIFALESHVWGPRTWTKNFKNEFLTLLQAKNNTFLPILPLKTMLQDYLRPLAQVENWSMREKPGLIRKFHQFLGLWEMN